MMKILSFSNLQNTLTKVVTFSSISLAILGTAAESAQALISRQTTFDAATGEKILFDWSYDSSAESDGEVSLDELEDWSWSHWSAAGDLTLLQNVVTDGTIDNWGVSGFTYSVSGDTLLAWNTGAGLYEGFFRSSSDFSWFWYRSWEDGMLVENSWVQGKTVLQNPVPETIVEEHSRSTPEPSLMLGFITLGGVLLGSKRKTKG